MTVTLYIYTFLIIISVILIILDISENYFNWGEKIGFYFIFGLFFIGYYNFIQFYVSEKVYKEKSKSEYQIEIINQNKIKVYSEDTKKQYIVKPGEIDSVILLDNL